MGMMDELVLKPLCLLDSLKPRIESLRLTDSRGETTAVKKLQISHDIKDTVSNAHDRTRGQQDDLLPDCSAVILTNCVDLVKYNSFVCLTLELMTRAFFRGLTA